jgi:hypothetical protein
MKPIGLALAAAMLAAGMAAPAAAHSPGEVLVIRGNQVSAAGEARPAPAARHTAPVAVAEAAEGPNARVTAEGRVLEVKALGAGDAIWFVEPDSGRLVACHLRNSVKAGRRVLRCWSGQERY